MADRTWAEYAELFVNDGGPYQSWLQASNFQSVQHHGIILYGDARNQQFLDSIETIRHVYSTGDRLSKLAHKHYGDARYWWLIAWFNGKPTDFHCKIGDYIYIPFPLRDVIVQAHSANPEFSYA